MKDSYKSPWLPLLHKQKKQKTQYILKYTQKTTSITPDLSVT